MRGTVDIVFASGELKASEPRLHAAIGQLRNDARFAVVTHSEHGCVVACGERDAGTGVSVVNWSASLAPATCSRRVFWWVSRTAATTTCGKYAALAAAGLFSTSAHAQQSLKRSPPPTDCA
jgi:hypothetical protein